MRDRVDDRSKVIIKFFITKLKSLAADNYGNLSYMQNLDNVIRDIYDYKNFIAKMNTCRTNAQFYSLFKDFGLQRMMDICNTPHIFSALNDLIEMDSRISEIEKVFKKNNKKGKKKDKKLVKEFDYLRDLYKDVVKKIRKEFDISPKNKSYKKKYGNAKSLVNSDPYYRIWDDDDLLYDDDNVFERVLSPYDDEDDEADEFTKFLYKQMGGKKSSKKRKPTRRGFDFDDDEDLDEIYDDDEDDDDERSSYETEMILDALDDMNQKYTSLYSVVNRMADSQTDINQSESIVVENFNRRQPQRPIITSRNVEGPNRTDIIIENLAKSVSQLTNAYNSLSVQNQQIMQVLQESVIDDEDDDYDEDDYMFQKMTEMQARKERRPRPDFDEYPNDPDRMSREQMIHLLNNQDAAKLVEEKIQSYVENSEDPNITTVRVEREETVEFTTTDNEQAPTVYPESTNSGNIRPVEQDQNPPTDDNTKE